MHLHGDASPIKCNQFVQAKKAQEGSRARVGNEEHIKQEAKEDKKQKKEAGIAAKDSKVTHAGVARPNWSATPSSTTHEHIRTQHVKKPRPAQQSAKSIVSPSPQASSPILPTPLSHLPALSALPSRSPK